MGKNILKMVLLLLGVIVSLVLVAGTAEAKSLYVNADLNANSPINAYDIQGNQLTPPVTEGLR